MPRTALTPQKATSSGVTLTPTAANALGHSYLRAQGRVLHVTNGSGGSINVTLITPGSVDSDLAVPDRVIAVPAATTKIIGIPAGTGDYDDVDGVHVDFSAVTSVTVALVDGA